MTPQPDAQGMPKAPASRTEDVGVLLKALDVLEQLTLGSPSGLTELAKATGANKASVFRILRTLQSRDFVIQDDATKKYAPGSRLFAIATSIVNDIDISAIVRPIMTPLWERFEETVNFAVLSGDKLRYLDVMESQQMLRTAPSPGSVDNLHSTALGKAMLAAMDRASAKRLIDTLDMERITESTIVDVKSLLDELDLIRKAGYALDDEESAVGASCVAVAIRRGDQPVSALSVSGPKVRFNHRTIMEITAELQDAAVKLTRLFGARDIK